MPGKLPPGKRKLPSLWCAIAVASVTVMPYLAGFSLADSPIEVDVGELKEGGEWLLGVGGFVWSIYTIFDHSENGDYDGGW